MTEFRELTLGGISVGMIYAAIALSLVLIWRATRILNYAQGGMAMFTTYIALLVINHTGSYWAGFAVALAAGLVLGGVIERLVIRPAENKPPLNAIIITIGLLVFLEGLAGILYGGQFRSFPAAFSITGLHVGSAALGVSARMASRAWTTRSRRRTWSAGRATIPRTSTSARRWPRSRRPGPRWSCRSPSRPSPRCSG